jgi:hypothetical protein
MTVEIDVSNGLSLEEWLKNDEVGELQSDLEKRIIEFLFNNDLSEFEFQQRIEQLAWIGSTPNDRPALEREIVQLNISSDGEILPCGLKKLWKCTCKVAHFIADHKFEILVGAAICATGIGIAAVTGYTVTATVAGVAVAGAGSVFARENKPNPRIPQGPLPSSKEEIALLQQPLSSLPKLNLPSSVNELLVTADGIWANGQFYPNNDLMQHSIIAQLPDLKIFPPTHAAEVPQSVHSGRTDEAQPPISQPFSIPGKQNPRCHIGWINGINNTFAESKESGKYLQGLTNGLTIAGIYNCSHTPVVDVLEAALLNYSGYSPLTAALLQKDWKSFHEANADRPNARLLQICHSQGAIHVKNALEGVAQEIRDRVIVIAIAPAAIVPRRLCFKSFNYASEKDIVYKFEPSAPRPIESITLDDVMIPTFGKAMDHRDELIILQPHSGAKGIDHEFQSPTFLGRLEKRLEDYNQRGGEYLPEEKGKLE